MIVIMVMAKTVIVMKNYDEGDDDNDDGNIDNDDQTWRFGNVADNIRWSSSSNGWPLYLTMTM